VKRASDPIKLRPEDSSNGRLLNAQNALNNRAAVHELVISLFWYRAPFPARIDEFHVRWRSGKYRNARKREGARGRSASKSRCPHQMPDGYSTPTAVAIGTPRLAHPPFLDLRQHMHPPLFLVSAKDTKDVT
jgi:hypothetical protein